MNRYASLEFAGARKSLLYFVTALSALALLCTAAALGADLLMAGGLSADNVVLELSSTTNTIAEALFGAGQPGTMAHVLTRICGVSWLLSACAWVYAFLSWREFMHGERTSPRHVYLGFLGTLIVEVLGVLSWPAGADFGTYAFGLFQLGLSGYVCMPVVMELRRAEPS